MLNQVSGVPDPNYRVPGNPIKFLKEDLDDKILPASPKVGQHTEEIIGSLLGLTKEEIQKLQDEKAI
jgi:crotonobetainyl-CoA:carnitine CoA-transferase CaiB-like acyl-CoA transferase